MLHLDALAPRTPRLPHRRLGPLTQLAASTALHITLVVLAALIETTSAPAIDLRRAEPITDQQRPDVRHIVFLAPELPRPGRGGGGGGNQRPDPIRRAQGVGADTITLRVQNRPSPPNTSQIRIVRSLDAGGLDEEAVAAVAQWRFEPGRLGATPVDVLVTIELDFFIR